LSVLYLEDCLVFVQYNCTILLSTATSCYPYQKWVHTRKPDHAKWPTSLVHKGLKLVQLTVYHVVLFNHKHWHGKRRGYIAPKSLLMSGETKMLRSTKSSSFLGHQKNLFLRALGWGSLQSKTDKTVQRDCRRGMPCQDRRGAHDMKERREHRMPKS